jgi:hypothetical protein
MTYYDWRSRPIWQGMRPEEQAAAMGLLERDGGKGAFEAGLNTIHANYNRADKENKPISDVLNYKSPSRAYGSFQPLYEAGQLARLPALLQNPDFQRYVDEARGIQNGFIADRTGGADSYLSHPSTMLKLEAGNPSKYKDWGPRGSNWTKYDPTTGRYGNEVARDSSHSFIAGGGQLAPERQQRMPELSLLDLETGANADPNRLMQTSVNGSVAPMQGASRGPQVASYAAQSPPMAPQPQGQKPMAEEPTFLDSLNGKMSNPLFQQGLGLFLASAQGKDMNAGLNAGMDRAQSAQAQRMKEDAEKRRLIQENAIKTLLNNPSAMAGVPEGLKEAVRISGDMGPINQFIMKTQGRDPLQVQQQQLEIQKMQRDLRRPEDDGSRTVELPGGKILRVPRGGTPEVIYEPDVQAERQKALLTAGLDPNSPQGKIFLATGKMPREDQQPLTATDKKAVIEAEDQAIAAQNTLTLLEEARKELPKTNQGPLAGARAWLGNALPDILVPDAISSKESSKATANYDNIMIGSALAQLKSVFGGNPSNAEREILVQIQGSSGLPQNVREDILRRAYALAEKRLRESQERAASFRGGTFYKPQQPKGAPSSDGWSIQKVD